MNKFNWKKLLLVPVVALTVSLTVASTAVVVASDWGDTGSVQEVPAPLNGIFVPKGFDNNDNAQVVITGAYPNSCYQVGRVDAIVDHEAKVVDVEVTAYYKADRMCLMLYTPFTEVVSLGVLTQGDYSLQVNNTMDTQKMPVALASSDSSDDFVYANVFGLMRRGDRGFELQGRLPKACAVLKEIKMIEEEGKIMVVLPIIEFPEGCNPHESDAADLGKSFNKKFVLPADIKGRYLIHVRSLNGGSINQVVEL